MRKTLVFLTGGIAAIVSAAIFLGSLAQAGEVVGEAKKALPENFRSGQLVAKLPDGSLGEPLEIRSHTVKVAIRDQIALVEVDEVFYNPADDRIEGTFHFPLPPDATICRLAMYVGDNLMEGEIAEAARARRTFEALKIQRVDPALLEWAGGNNFKMRVYPIEAKSEKRVMISYFQVLKKNHGQIDFTYPLVSDALQKNPVGKIGVNIEVRHSGHIAKANSVGPELEIRKNGHGFTASFAVEKINPSQDVRLVYEIAKGEGELAVLPYWHEADREGYFLMIFSPDFEEYDSEKELPGRFVFVLDKSGGLGEKQLALAKQTLQTSLSMLKSTDLFGIVAYDAFAKDFRKILVEASRENLDAAEKWLEGLSSMGASSLPEAWRAAANLAGTEPTQLIYIGSGLSTLTSTRTGKLLAEAENAFENSDLRLHCLPLGAVRDDAFLGELAKKYSGTVRPVANADDMMENVSELMLDYGWPLYKNLKFTVEGADLDEVYPLQLPNVAAGRQALVFGKYRKQGKVTVNLSAQYKDKQYEKSFTIDFGGDAGNNFVPCLWATRKINHLQQQASLVEAEESVRLVRTVVETSKRYTVMSQYTSFLVLETPEDYARYGIERRVREFGPYRGQGSEVDFDSLQFGRQEALRKRDAGNGMAGGGEKKKELYERAKLTAGAAAMDDGEGGEAEKPSAALKDTADLPPAPGRAGGDGILAFGLAKSEEHAVRRASVDSYKYVSRYETRASSVADVKEIDVLAWARTDIFPKIDDNIIDYETIAWHRSNRFQPAEHNQHSSKEALDALRKLQARIRTFSATITHFSIDAEGKEVKQGRDWKVLLDVPANRVVSYQVGEDYKDVCDGQRRARFFPLLRYAATRAASPRETINLCTLLPGYLLPWTEKLEYEYLVTLEEEGKVIVLTRRGNSFDKIRLFLNETSDAILRVEIYGRHYDQKTRATTCRLLQVVTCENFEEKSGVKIPAVIRIESIGADNQTERRKMFTERKAGVVPTPMIKPGDVVIRIAPDSVNEAIEAKNFTVEIPKGWAERNLDAVPANNDRNRISPPVNPGFNPGGWRR